jgi:hypothetical protein
MTRFRDADLDAARRSIDEHRPFPRFVRGRCRYTVRRDGRVDIERAEGTSGRMWVFEITVEPASKAIPPDVRARIRA